MKVTVVNQNSAFESQLDELPSKWEYIAALIVNSDSNGNGDAEVRFIDADQVRSTIHINGWTLGSSIMIRYWWGNSTLRMFVTDPIGKTNEIIIEINVGSKSSYWGVSAVNSIVSKFKDIAAKSGWIDFEQENYKSILKKQINDILLQREVIDIKLLALENELKALIAN